MLGVRACASVRACGGTTAGGPPQCPKRGAMCARCTAQHAACLPHDLAAQYISHAQCGLLLGRCAARSCRPCAPRWWGTSWRKSECARAGWGQPLGAAPGCAAPRLPCEGCGGSAACASRQPRPTTCPPSLPPRRDIGIDECRELRDILGPLVADALPALLPAPQASGGSGAPEGGPAAGELSGVPVALVRGPSLGPCRSPRGEPFMKACPAAACARCTLRTTPEPVCNAAHRHHHHHHHRARHTRACSTPPPLLPSPHTCCPAHTSPALPLACNHISCVNCHTRLN